MPLRLPIDVYRSNLSMQHCNIRQIIGLRGVPAHVLYYAGLQTLSSSLANLIMMVEDLTKEN